MSFRKKHVTSIDDILKWLDVSYNPNLPDPAIFDAEIYKAPVFERLDGFRISEKTFPTETKIKYKRYRKCRIISPKGGTLFCWEEEPS